MELRPYQVQAIRTMRATFQSGSKSVVLAAPTGSGKTIMGVEMVRSAVARHNRVLWLAHREELLKQVSDKLTECGLRHGIIMASLPPMDPTAPIQLASVQTLSRRKQTPPANLVVVDEAHHVCSGSYRKLLTGPYATAWRVGLTATPYRLDGHGLGEFFSAIVKACSYEEMLIEGYLVPARIFAPSTPDMTGVRVQAGEFVNREAAARVDQPDIIGDVVGTWQKLAAGRTTAVFACSILHSTHIIDAFKTAGVSAEHLDGDTAPDRRRDILARVHRGELCVVSNCMILTEGWDLPRCSCVVQARPTMSRCLWRQMIGRGLRPFEGKDDCIVLDHASNAHRFGLPITEDEYDLWSVKAKTTKQEGVSIRQCPKCFAILPGQPQNCQECGHVFVVAPKIPTVGPGVLREQNWQSGLNQINSEPARRRFLQRRLQIAKEKNYKDGWAAYQYRAVWGTWPPDAWMPKSEEA